MDVLHSCMLKWARHVATEMFVFMVMNAAVFANKACTRALV